MLNTVNIQGRITADLELKTTANGKPVLSFTIACERDSADKAVDFVDIVCFNSTAEFVNNYFRKGNMIVVNGRLQSRKWQDLKGNNRINWEVLCSHAYFCGGRADATEAKPKSVFVDEPDIDGDLPF